MSWVMWRLYLGRLLNVLGMPAFVRSCDYRSQAIGATVKVEHRDLFTIITVNGLDVYFSRITGIIDGVGFNPTACCTTASDQESTDLAELLASETPQAHMQKTPG
jgi:hypothetical protein